MDYFNNMICLFDVTYLCVTIKLFNYPIRLNNN